MKKQLLIGMFTATLQVGTLAATQEECQAEVLKVVQMPAIKKMLEAQRNDVESVGNDLCYFRSKYEANKDRVLELSDLLEQLIKLNASFCGPNPDSIGRGATCRKAKDEEETKASELALKVSELKKGDKKIRKLVAQYEKLRTSKPLQTNAPELSVAGRRTAAIAKVKGNILESLKDPDSAIFRRISSSSEGSIICGEVNAKNSMGGFVGYRKFINFGTDWDDFTFYEETGNSVFSEACEKQAEKR